MKKKGLVWSQSQRFQLMVNVIALGPMVGDSMSQRPAQLVGEVCLPHRETKRRKGLDLSIPVSSIHLTQYCLSQVFTSFLHDTYNREAFQGIIKIQNIVRYK